MELSIIYVNYNVEKLIIESIKSLRWNRKTKLEIIVVDNSANKDLEKKLNNIDKKIVYINPKKNLGFGNACNLGAKKAKGKFLLFLNPDTKVKKNALNSMLDFMGKDKKIGALGPKIVSSDNKIQPSISRKITRITNIFSYSIIDKIWKNNAVSKNFWLKNVDRSSTQQVDVIGGACMMVPRKIFTKVGRFDPQFFMYFEEYDLCDRIRESGYKIVYFPMAKIMHIKGQSMKNKKTIKKYFEKSRFLYSKKHFGLLYSLLSEAFIRNLNTTSLLFLMIFAVSFIVNTFELRNSVLFIGDIARDFLIAKKVIFDGQTFPLVGIPSSVTWLHQGPLSQWLVILALSISNISVSATSFIFGLINALSSALVFIVGKKYFNKIVGLLAAILYIAMPIAVVNARMPYHTSLVPFFALIFFFILKDSLTKPKYLPLLFLSLGLLLLVELSNIVVIGIIAVLFIHRKIILSMKKVLLSILCFALGIWPFIIYDFINGPTYIKFPLWIFYRIFRVITFSGGNSEHNIGFFETVYQQLGASLIPKAGIFSIFIFVISFSYILYIFNRNKKLLSEEIVILWVSVPFLAFLIHSAPGTAYFALLYPVLALVFSYFLFNIFKTKISLFIVLTILSINLISLVSNNFFINTSTKENLMPPVGYSFGYSSAVYEEIAVSILSNSKNSSVSLNGEGSFSFYKTSLDPIKFYLEKNGLIVNSLSKEKFIVIDGSNFKQNLKPIFSNKVAKIYKYE